MEKITAVVEGIIFRNEENGYTVAEVSMDEEELFVAVGTVPQLYEGMTVELEGEWGSHATYGRQFQIASAAVRTPDSLDGIRRYLSSGIVPGVGPVTAQRLVERFGEETLDVLRYQPGRLSEVNGISPKKAREMAQGFAEHYEMQSSMVFLQSIGVTAGFAARIYKQYGSATEAKVRADPYSMVDDVEGIGFRTADRIAQTMGLDPASPERAKAGLKHVLREYAGQNGHTCLPQELLLREARRLLGADAPVDEALGKLVITGGVKQERMDAGVFVWLPLYRYAEKEVAAKLTALAGERREMPWADVPAMVDEIVARQGIDLSQEQRAAVLDAVTSGVTVITGGPGTGKTTTLNCLLDVMDAAGWEVALGAPTGRAAKRMTEATGREAKTLHRLLEYGGMDGAGSFKRDEENPIEADAVVVDEMSMVDLLLMQGLLRAVEPGCRLVLVGDADQLPSVGAGNVLKDLIQSGVPQVARLTRIYRQAQESLIVTNAHRVNQGEMPVLNRVDSDFFFERKNSLEEAMESTVGLVAHRLVKFKGYDRLKDIQVLAPMKKGELGVYALNARLQSEFNPPAGDKPEVKRGDFLLRRGDKVMQIKNNYTISWVQNGETGEGVFNGDMGFLVTLDTAGRLAQVEFDDGRLADYDFAQLEELQLAYAVSIHKSQGSEFPVVVLPLVGGPPMLLTRNLLYTAITRARQMVVICGREECVRRMVENNTVVQRYTGLLSAFAQLKDLDELSD
ncbi:MAG: ATP-dependent RecD-like DNA helicase [Eubacteriales bacterium]|nr:ATP-dependent RecD-like DNA helicase [Eubacteriales bacterium]